ncbi:MAG: hypothetical protein EGQ88_01775 [Prevotellamassilia timonensis]|nr:hypothetical protein [Prevotellamassilia timonensis]
MQIFVYNLYTFFVECNALVLPSQHFNFVQNQIVLTTMKRMLNRMLRYADAIVKRGVDKLIDAIAHSAEPQSKNAETPQPQKSMGNNTDCAPQTTDDTTNCGQAEQAITLMNELCDIRYNVLDRTPEVQRRDQADKGSVPVSKLVCNTMVIDLHKRGRMVWNNDVDRIVELNNACSARYWTGVQLQVPRRHNSNTILYCVRRKHDKGVDFSIRTIT